MKRLNTVGMFNLAIVIVCAFLISPNSSLAAGPNLISNSSLETHGTSGNPQDWYKGKWGNNTAVFTYPATGPDGSRAAEVTLSNRVTGDAKWTANDVALESGREYRFEDAYKATRSTYLTIRYKLQNGTFIYKDLTQPPASASWRTISVNFVVPSGVVSGTIFHLINGDGTLTIDNAVLQATDAPVPTGRVSLSFDDGHREVYETAIPILNNYGLKSTQYIVTGYFGFPGYVTPAQVLEVENAGHEIGAHTRTHRDLTTLSTSTAASEIFGSRNDLLGIGVKSVTTFAYPFGSYNNTIKQFVANAGMKGSRSSNGGFNVKGTTDYYALARKNMGPESSLAQVKLWIDEAMRDRKWLVLVFHHIDNSGSSYSVPASFVESVAAYLVEHSVPVVTVSTGIDILKQ